jgi:hypothetical protein
MKKLKFLHSINKTSKRGVTLPEVIISILFTAIIFSTAVSIWFVGGKVFKDTEEVSLAYNQARSLETMLQNAASVAPSLAFTANLESSEGIFGSSLPAGKAESDYFRFYYSEAEAAFFLSYYPDGYAEPMIIEYDALTRADDVRIGFSAIGESVLMKYKLARTNDDSYFIEGGIVLNYVSPGSYPAMRNLDYNLYFHVEEGF